MKYLSRAEVLIAWHVEAHWAGWQRVLQHRVDAANRELALGDRPLIMADYPISAFN